MIEPVGRVRRIRTPTLCECGCGQETKLSTRTWAKYGMVKGKPLRFIKGHNTGVGNKPVRDRLLAYIDVVASGCWLWVGAVRSGYGAIGVQGKILRAHRVSYEEFVGPIPDASLVLHTCDTPLCINPAHLVIGTHQDNSDDKVSKGRQARGENNGMATITERDVLAIRAFEVAHSYQETADTFGVSKGTVADIINGRTWTHV